MDVRAVLVRSHSVSYLLNRDHVMAMPLADLVNADAAVESRIASTVATWSTRPGAIVLFGSFARRGGLLSVETGGPA